MSNENNVFLRIVVTVVSSLTTISGVAESWSSPLLPKLTKNVPHHHDCYKRPITQTEESLIASLLQLGIAFGCIASIYTSPRIGKKKTIFVFTTFSLVSYLLTGFGRNIHYLYLARFLSGFGTSCCLTVIPQYINELLHHKNKGPSYNLMGIFLASGILFSFMVGPYSDIREFSFICIVFIGLMLTIFNIWVPETPQFLASLGDQEKAEMCLRKLRGNVEEAEIKREFSEILQTVNYSNAYSSSIYCLKMSLKPFIICIGLLCFQELSGISVILSYTQSIFEETHGIPADISSTIIGGFKLVSAILIAQIMEKVNKRNLLLISSFGNCLSLGFLGLYFFAADEDLKISEKLYWVPLASLVTYTFSFNIGFQYVAWEISTKVFQPCADVLASSIAHATSKFISFSLTLTFPCLADMFGLEYCFWGLAVFCLFALIFVFIFVPSNGKYEPSESKSDLSLQFHIPP